MQISAQGVSAVSVLALGLLFGLFSLLFCWPMREEILWKRIAWPLPPESTVYSCANLGMVSESLPGDASWCWRPKRDWRAPCKKGVRKK